jgi:hypothetical protein
MLAGFEIALHIAVTVGDGVIASARVHERKAWATEYQHTQAQTLSGPHPLQRQIESITGKIRNPCVWMQQWTRTWIDVIQTSGTKARALSVSHDAVFLGDNLRRPNCIQNQG